MPHRPGTAGNLILVNPECRDSRRQARAHLARCGIRKRIRKQAAKDVARSSPESRSTSLSQVPTQIPLKGPIMVECLISSNVFMDLSHTWGVSPAICPGPANLSHSLSRKSDVLDCIFRANVAFHWIGLNPQAPADQKRNMEIVALTYRGQAIDLANKELSWYTHFQKQTYDNSMLPQSQPSWETVFSIVLRLLQLDYRCAHSDVKTHFAACRELLRSSATNVGQQTLIERSLLSIRNPHLHHLLATFECINCTAESVIWDDRDVALLRQRLDEFLVRISVGTRLSIGTQTVHGSTPIRHPRIPQSTILWKCLAKEPAPIPSNIYQDVSEWSAQLAALLILCSVFLDYDEADALVGRACVEDLENALLAVGEKDVVSSALNPAWLIAGGVGLPLTARRARIWSVLGMVYALKRSTGPGALEELNGTGQRIHGKCAKQICLEYLGNSTSGSSGLALDDDNKWPPTRAIFRLLMDFLTASVWKRTEAPAHSVLSLPLFNMTLSWASLSEFRKLSDGIYIYDPKLEPNGHVVAGHNEQGPSTIILFTWADASVRLISKYFEGYRTLYPSAKIIVVTATTMKTFFAGPEDAKSFVKPMVEKELSPIISNIGSSSGAASTPEGSLNLRREKERGVLVHAFSNSGGLNLEAVWSVWHALQISQGQSIGPLPIHGLILDSTPGGPSFRREFGRWTAGVAMGFAFLPKICAKLVATLIVLVLMGIPNLLGKESLAARGRRVLNSPQNIPLNSARLYIYSDSDLLIGHSDVESHAQDARDKGYKKVKLERFSGSGHVAHMRQDPKRYWATISKFWDECCV